MLKNETTFEWSFFRQTYDRYNYIETRKTHTQQKMSTLAVKMIKMRVEESKKSSTRYDTVNEQHFMTLKKQKYANLHCLNENPASLHKKP